MRKARSIGLLALAASLFVAGCSVFGGKAADEPAYRLVEQDGAIEIREYAGFAVAETIVVAPFDEATGIGFRRLAQPRNEMREVTASSLTPGGDESWTIAFVLPEGVTAETAPTPTDDRVTLRDLPSRRVASIKFTGRFRNAAAEEKRQLLADWLAARGLTHQGDWQFAGYNPPWTVPALRRNEVLVTLQ
jgi:hypothetical protein